jgi:hypothetical protein
VKLKIVLSLTIVICLHCRPLVEFRALCLTAGQGRAGQGRTGRRKVVLDLINVYREVSWFLGFVYFLVGWHAGAITLSPR